MVGVPFYFQFVLSDGTPDSRRWAFFVIGGFLTLWITLYGAVQAAAPRIATSRARPHNKGHPLGRLPCANPFALAAAAMAAGAPAPWLTSTLIAGLLLFGFVVAVSSAVHSYLILAFGGASRISRDVGFYYMSNAAGRLLGTLLSGLNYQNGGQPLCLVTAEALALLAWLAACCLRCL